MRFMEPTQESLKTWNTWLESATPALREIGRKVDPWTVYRVPSTKTIVTLLSLEQDATFKVTVWHDSRKHKEKRPCPYNAAGVPLVALVKHTGSIPTTLQRHVKNALAKQG